MSGLISLLGPHVNVLRTSCTECYINSKLITVAEIAHLLVVNKQKEYTLAIDLSVYAKNQQFRLFNCVKKKQQNPLIQTSFYPCHENTETSYFEILKKSLVTYHDGIQVPILKLKDNEFLCQITDARHSTVFDNYNAINLNTINTHNKNFFSNATASICISNSIKPNISTQIKIQNNSSQFQQYVQQFKPFVENLIKSDSSHQGFIRSCVPGNRNTDIIFYNIGGHYRFCPHKGTHHQRNTTAILIDINNSTYAIRCKDPDCENSVLAWKNIE
jgi:IS1 family transposase